MLIESATNIPERAIKVSVVSTNLDVASKALKCRFLQRHDEMKELTLLTGDARAS